MDKTEADWTGSNTELPPCFGIFEIQDTAVENHTQRSW